jgi:hypothetical protein
VEGAVRVVEIDRRILAEHLDFEPGFFAAFADGGGGGGLQRFDLTAGKLPKAGERHALGPRAGQKQVAVADYGHGDTF